MLASRYGRVENRILFMLSKEARLRSTAGYLEFIRSATPASLSLWDKDRYLGAKSAAADLGRDIQRWAAL